MVRETEAREKDNGYIIIIVEEHAPGKVLLAFYTLLFGSLSDSCVFIMFIEIDL